MRIQHNIAALNAHRQLTNNNNSVSKNLEKLSSGYKINRAGDDAAGLAISEKMRAQITGLETAQKNANDGISLVQTAEGALTEVHSMLNRMVELAEQSANGTYENTVDRNNLQKELNSLRTEMDRIADGTNFNGINLLNGSLGGARISSTPGTAAVSGTPATKSSFDVDLTEFLKSGIKDTQSVSIGGVTIAATGDLDAAAATSLISTEIGKNAAKEYTFDGKTYTATMNGSTITFTAKDAGADTLDAAKIADAFVNNDGGAKATVDAVKNLKNGIAEVPDTPAVNAKTEIEFGTQPKVGDTIKIGETTYEFVAADGDTVSGTGNTAITIGNDSDATAANFKTAIGSNTAIQNVAGTGSKVTFETADDATDATKPVTIEQQAKGLTLQIGDTADDFNKLSVSVNSMKADALGIGSIDIGTQDGAAAAIKKIKDAINTVSSTRGDLGAIQNRLEHTINNLSVTSENMTAAESRIRDVDMAQEMMEFTKNNILTQASQSMLAQANQLPQGVLQLLQ